MKRMLLFGILLGWAALTGCSAVYVTEPVGKLDPAWAGLNAGDWEGTWVADEDSFQIFVTDAPKGEMNVVMVGHNLQTNGVPKMAVLPAWVRPAGDQRWLLTVTEDADSTSTAPKKLAFCGLLKLDGNQCIVWGPNAEQFGAWIKQSKLVGKIEKDEAYLGPLTARDLDQITSPTTMLLRWQDPGVLRRLKK